VHPRTIAAAAGRLREATVAQLDDCDDDQLEVEALPGWTVADVYRHLADSDRGSVLAVHLRHLMSGRSLDDFEEVNDRNVGRRRERWDRDDLRRALIVWGRRLAKVIRAVPAPLARLRVPTAFGTVPVAWLGGLRLYDEWVHQWDVATALDRPVPQMDAPTREVVAEVQLRALTAGPLRDVESERTVQITFTDVQAPPWRFDLAAHRAGPDVDSDPHATVTTDVRTFSLVAADRRPWRQARDAGDIEVTGADPAVGEWLLDRVRLV
jgi:uncharacterized protein (TIGR03083 family)